MDHLRCRNRADEMSSLTFVPRLYMSVLAKLATRSGRPDARVVMLGQDMAAGSWPVGITRQIGCLRGGAGGGLGKQLAGRPVCERASMRGMACRLMDMARE